jgi:3-hydroxyacyl-CoA dehydrogenase
MKNSTGFLPFRKVGVLGAGVMGAQIAAHLANAGLEVVLLDIAAKEGNKNSIVEGAFKKIQKLKPAPFASKEAMERISLGNFDEHMPLLKDAEWVIEAVIEHLPIKQELMQKLEDVVGEQTIISTNTSGLPIHKIAEGRSESFQRRFLGTHFFNPPRYMKLLELIPTPKTDSTILEHISWFGRIYLGKSIVIAKDTPNFIANRIGVYATIQAMRYFTDGDYTIEEIDTLTGPIIGHPKSATFRTADVVGLDTLKYVADNLYEMLPNEKNREKLKAPELLTKMVENKILGQKSGSGFYKKVGKDILSINKETLEYEPPKPLNLGDLENFQKAGSLVDRIRALYNDTGRAGKFTRETLLDLFSYCACRIPEIADSPADIDKAIKWGFVWEMGPFETWDALGFEKVLNDMQEMGLEVPQWVTDMPKNGAKSFYKDENGTLSVYVPGKGYIPETTYPDELHIPQLLNRPEAVIFENKEARLLDMGDGVALYEFRSKANSLGAEVVKGLLKSVEIVENGNYKGLVIGNGGKNFSVGANLGEAAYALQNGMFDQIEGAVKLFQDMVNRIRYARKPVVTALHGMALGGACEIAMASSNVVAALETYIGLVELGAGLIPAGCGTTYLAAQAAKRAANEFPSQVQDFVAKYFENVATAKVATSAFEGIEIGYLPPQTKVVMHADRRLYVAKEEVLRMAHQGYAPPAVRNAIYVLGASGRAALETAAYLMHKAGYATEYDVYLAKKLAWIMTGGDITMPAKVHEQYLYDLEREVFLELLKQPKTQERIHSILTTNKPLRN